MVIRSESVSLVEFFESKRVLDGPRLRFALLELGLVVGFMGLVALLEIWVWGLVLCWRLIMGRTLGKNKKE